MDSIYIVFQLFCSKMYFFNSELFCYWMPLWSLVKFVLIFAYAFLPFFVTFLWIGYLLSATSFIQRRLILKTMLYLMKIRVVGIWKIG